MLYTLGSKLLIHGLGQKSVKPISRVLKLHTRLH